jgi:hypothetical protein
LWSDRRGPDLIPWIAGKLGQSEYEWKQWTHKRRIWLEILLPPWGAHVETDFVFHAEEPYWSKLWSIEVSIFLASLIAIILTFTKA